MMNTWGFFDADDEHAYLLTSVQMDPDRYPHFALMLPALEAYASGAGLLSHEGSYLMYADAGQMREDEKEFEWDYYSYGVAEGMAQPQSTIDVEDERDVLPLLLTHFSNEGLTSSVTARDIAVCLERFDGAVAAEEARLRANDEISVGAPVHTACSCGYVRDQMGQHYNSLAVTPRSFQANWDARLVLRDSEVNYAVGKAAITTYPMPPLMVKKSGKYWAQLNDGHTSFLGRTQRDLARKAAIHLAWIDKFGPHR